MSHGKLSKNLEKDHNTQKHLKEVERLRFEMQAEDAEFGLNIEDEETSESPEAASTPPSPPRSRSPPGPTEVLLEENGVAEPGAPEEPSQRGGTKKKQRKNQTKKVPSEPLTKTERMARTIGGARAGVQESDAGSTGTLQDVDGSEGPGVDDGPANPIHPFPLAPEQSKRDKRRAKQIKKAETEKSSATQVCINARILLVLRVG